ncbi:MAG TPA: CU044_2847 family protein [Acetobacteraceae bacterium]|jgi:hypothetical protein
MLATSRSHAASHNGHRKRSRRPAQVKPGVEALVTQLRDLTAKPETVSLEFGIKFTAGADALIAKTSVEGNVKVTLTWKPE